VDPNHEQDEDAHPRIAPVRREITHLPCPVFVLKQPASLHFDIGTLIVTKCITIYDDCNPEENLRKFVIRCTSALVVSLVSRQKRHVILNVERFARGT
jgi:hypothetical protein